MASLYLPHHFPITHAPSLLKLGSVVRSGWEEALGGSTRPGAKVHGGPTRPINIENDEPIGLGVAAHNGSIGSGAVAKVEQLGRAWWRTMG